MQLPNLPNEILCEIFRQVQPPDLENFAQGSRQIASVAQSFLRNHRSLIQKYTKCKADLQTTTTRASFISKLADEIAADPRIGQYVRHLRKCDYAPPWQCASQLAAFEGLLNGVPNLNTLSIDESNALLLHLRGLFDPPKAIRGTLSKLREVSLASADRQGVPFSLIGRFSALPAVRLMKVTNADSVPDEVAIAPVQSRVLHLDLQHCKIRPKDMEILLRGFTRLKSFTYSCGFNDGISAFAIPVSLQSCRDSLTKLVWNAPRRPKCHLGDLRRFEALQELETEFGFLGVSSSGNERSLQLPMSLVSLKVLHSTERFHSTGQPDSEYTDLVESITTLKSSRKSHLQRVQAVEVDKYDRVVIKPPSEPYFKRFQGLKDAYHALGISFIFGEMDDTVRYRRGQHETQLLGVTASEQKRQAYRGTASSGTISLKHKVTGRVW